MRKKTFILSTALSIGAFLSLYLPAGLLYAVPPQETEEKVERIKRIESKLSKEKE
jgi:hypothetical protein